VTLAVGFEKLKDEGGSGLPGMENRSNTHYQSTPPGMFAMMATKYFEQYGLTPEAGKTMLAKISVKSHKNAVSNPKAHFRREITIEQVLNAPIIAWPLGLFDCCGVSDGAAAAILARPEVAKRLRPDPVYIKALQICASPTSGRMTSDYDYAHVEEAYRGGIAAYKEAGIKEPRKEIGMAEVHDCFSITEAVTMEDLQFSQRGKVKEDIDAGFFEMTGGLPVQPDGGLKCFGHPIGASGIRMVYELYLQLLGRAGKRQIKNPKLGLAHNMGNEPYAPVVSICIVGL
jgi:acetyl-CoA C-acetyltransferase